MQCRGLSDLCGCAGHCAPEALTRQDTALWPGTLIFHRMHQAMPRLDIVDYLES